MTPLVRTGHHKSHTMKNVVLLPWSDLYHGIGILAGLMEDNYVVEGEGEAEGKGA